jgi:hypothetical protein
MAIRVVLTLLLAVGLVARGQAAQTARNPQPLPTQPIKSTPSIEVPTHDPACFDTYINTGIPLGYYYPAGTGVEVLDDLHLGAIYVDDLCAIDFGYYNGGPGTTDATVTLYTNNVDDDPPGASLTSLSLPGLAVGESSFHVEVASAALTQEVWLGVSFSTEDAGLLVADPPWPGASDDYFYMRPPSDYFTFGGNPRSNFLLGVYATGTTVAVEPGSERAGIPGFRGAPSPNPTTGGLTVGFAVRDAGRVRAEVLDISGRLVTVIVNDVYRPGVHTIAWDGMGSRGKRVAPGAYLLRLSVPGFSGTRKIILTN